MAPVALGVLSVFLALISLPQAQAISGPACARRNYKSGDCLSKCQSNWGFGSHVMGQQPWGPVVSSLPTDTSIDDVVFEACGFLSSSGESSISSTYSVVESTPVPVPYTTPVSHSSSSPSSSTATSSLPVSSSSPVSVNSSPLSSPYTSPTKSSSSSSLSSHSSSPTSSSSSSGFSPKLTPTSASVPSPSPYMSSSSSSSSSSAPSSPPDSTGGSKSTSRSSSTSSSDIDAYLTAHNTIRAKYGATDLTWNDDLATAAQQWASGCVFEHSGGSLGPYGENLAAGTGDYTIADGVGDWASEASQYSVSDPVPSHFTQIVWKATTQLGCALVSCGAGTIFDASYGPANYIVCEYSPAGNVIGEFVENVLA